MALILEETLSSGIVGEYWVLVPLYDQSNYSNKMTKFILLLYKDLQSRSLNKKFIKRERFKWAMEGVENSWSSMYAFIKQSRLDANEVETNKFVNAQDSV